MTYRGDPGCTTILDVLRRFPHGRRPANPEILAELLEQSCNVERPRYRLPMSRLVAEFFRDVHAVARAFLPATEFHPGRANRRRQSAREFRAATKDPVVFCPGVSATP